MMFNDKKWQEMLSQELADIQASDDKSWLDTIDFRYGQWMARQSMRTIEHALSTLAMIDHSPDRKKLLVYASEAIASSTKVAQTAALLIGGDLCTKNPERTEAILRVYERASAMPGDSHAGV